jgi:hypothetical protein
MTIQGGEGPAAAVAVPAPHQPSAADEGSYGLTVVSTGNNGGGLGDYGVFFNEAVFTDYLNVSSSKNDPQTNWILQYAVLNSGGVLLDNLVPPFPLAKVKPEWPSDLVNRYRGQLLVAYVVIDIEGKMRSLRMVQSPNIGFYEGLSKAFDAWHFRPARVDGKPIAVKALLGIPIR